EAAAARRAGCGRAGPAPGRPASRARAGRRPGGRPRPQVPAGVQRQLRRRRSRAVRVPRNFPPSRRGTLKVRVAPSISVWHPDFSVWHPGTRLRAATRRNLGSTSFDVAPPRSYPDPDVTRPPITPARFSSMQKRANAVTFKGTPYALVGPQLKVGD